MITAKKPWFHCSNFVHLSIIYYMMRILRVCTEQKLEGESSVRISDLSLLWRPFHQHRIFRFSQTQDPTIMPTSKLNIQRTCVNIMKYFEPVLVGVSYQHTSIDPEINSDYTYNLCRSRQKWDKVRRYLASDASDKEKQIYFRSRRISNTCSY